MKVSEVFQPQLFTCQATDRLDVAARTMVDKKVGALPVLDDRQIVGIISERDITRAVAAGADPSVETTFDYASTRLKVATPDDDTVQLAHVMIEAGLRHMPVVHEGRLVGIVSMRDLLALEIWG